MNNSLQFFLIQHLQIRKARGHHTPMQILQYSCTKTCEYIHKTSVFKTKAYNCNNVDERTKWLSPNEMYVDILSDERVLQDQYFTMD